MSNGGEYILGREVTSLSPVEKRFLGFVATHLHLPVDFDHRFDVETTPEHYEVLRDTPPTLMDPVDTVIVEHWGLVAPTYLSTSISFGGIAISRARESGTWDLYNVVHISDESEGEKAFYFRNDGGDLDKIQDESEVDRMLDDLDNKVLARV
jgi:hypothetical protein